MKITVAKNEAVFDRAACGRIVNQICAKPTSVIGLSTGRTTGNIHRLVCRVHDEENFDVSNVTFFGLDEVTNVPKEYSGACYTMLRTEIIDDLGVDDAHFMMLPTISEDFEAACREFRAELARRIVLVAKGANKREAVRQMLTVAVSTDCPASVLQLHPDCEFLLDTESAADIDVNSLRDSYGK